MSIPLKTSEIRVLVVEDHGQFRRFVCARLQELVNVQIIGEVEDGVQAIHEAEALQPDVILLDIGLPRLNGIEVARRIGQVACEARIIFLTQESSPEVVQAALDLGGWGYILKVNARSELLAAVKAVSQRERFVGSGLDGYSKSTTTKR